LYLQPYMSWQQTRDPRPKLC